MEFMSPFKFPSIEERINESAVVFNGEAVKPYKEFTAEDLQNPINREIYEETVAYNYINETSIKKSEVDPKDFGLPAKKKYPMPDEKHVKSAIKFFNYAGKEDEEELAKNIKKKIKQYNITDISVGEKNRFSKYYKSEEKKKAVNEMYHGEANSHMEFESVLFGDGEIVEEGKIADAFKSAIEAVKKAIVNLIDKITAFLDKHPDSRIANGLKDLLGKVKGLLTKADKAQSKEDVDNVKSDLEKSREKYDELMSEQNYDVVEAVVTTDTIRKQFSQIPRKNGYDRYCLVTNHGNQDKNGNRNIYGYLSCAIGYHKRDTNDYDDAEKVIKIGYKQLAMKLEHLLKTYDNQVIIEE